MGNEINKERGVVEKTFNEVPGAGEYSYLVRNIARQRSAMQYDVVLSYEDLLSESVYWLHIGIEKYDGRGKLPNYLYHFIDRKVRDFIRSVVKRGTLRDARLSGFLRSRSIGITQEFEDDLGNSYMYNLCEKFADLDVELKADIALCLRAAPEPVRTMIVMRLNDHSNQEIGDYFGVSHARISQRVSPYLNRYFGEIMKEVWPKGTKYKGRPKLKHDDSKCP